MTPWHPWHHPRSLHGLQSWISEPCWLRTGSPGHGYENPQQKLGTTGVLHTAQMTMKMDINPIDIYGYHFMMMVLAMVMMTTILMQSSLCNIAGQLWIFHLQGPGWARQPYIHHVPWWLLPIPWQFTADCGYWTGLIIPGNPLGPNTQPHHHPCPIHL